MLKQTSVLLFAVLLLNQNSLAQTTIEPLKNYCSQIQHKRKSTENSTQSIFLSGQDITSKSTIDFEYSLRVTKPANEQFIYLNCNRIHGTIEEAGVKKEIPFDSKNLIQMILGVNQNGVIDSIKSDLMIINQMKTAYKQRIQKGKQNPYFLNVQSTRNIGDEWLDSSLFDNESNYIITKYKFVKAENNQFVLSFQSDIKILSEFYSQDILIIDSKVGNCTGTIYVEPTTNYILKTEGSVQLEGNRNVNTREIPTSIKSTFIDSIINN